MKRYDEALEQMDKAVELDPLSLIIRSNVGQALSSAGRYDEAIPVFLKTIEMDPSFSTVHFNLSAAYYFKGMCKEAVAEWIRGNTAYGWADVTEAMAQGLAQDGCRGAWQGNLAALKERAKREFIGPSYFWDAYIRLGDRDRAIEWLEKGFQQRVGALGFIHADPFFDPLRKDPRFQDLIRRMKFPQ